MRVFKINGRRLQATAFQACLMILTLICGSAMAKSTGAPTSSRPNFIFVLIDDMGYGDLSCYGGNAGQTPHIDSLAREGIRFSQFYAASPICSPSRTAFTTGQCPARWGVTSFLASRAENERRGMAQWLDPRAPTLARVLQQAGYATGHFGKWHMGGQRDVGDAPLITEYGFNESVTQFEGLGDRILPLLDAFDGAPAQKYALGSDNLGRGKIEWLDRSKISGAFVERSLAFIQRMEKAGTPFYANVWLDDVHSPFYPPKALRTDNQKRELYLNVVKAMDAQLAPLFDYIRRSPTLRSNTMIIVASDNGPEPGAGSAGPFRGHKGMLYEGGVREPLIVWAPGLMAKKARGSVNETTVVSALDFFPSFARLAGVELPRDIAFDGEDLSGTLTGKAKGKRTKPLYWNRPPDRPGNNGATNPDLAMRENNWKLLLMQDGSNVQLYNLAADPGENRNLASKHVDVVRRMSGPLLNWWQSIPTRRSITQQSPKPDAIESKSGGSN